MSLKIKEIIETREFHNLVLNRYRGPYALGLSGENKVTISLPDTAEADQVVAQTITFGSLKIVVEIERGWKPPKSFKAK